jgi:hypothetical protein
MEMLFKERTPDDAHGRHRHADDRVCLLIRKVIKTRWRVWRAVRRRCSPSFGSPIVTAVALAIVRRRRSRSASAVTGREGDDGRQGLHRMVVDTLKKMGGNPPVAS